MLNLVTTADGLIIAYPPWLGALPITLGLALAFWLARHFAREARSFGYAMAVLVLFAGGAYFLTYSVKLTPASGRAFALFQGGHSQVDWRDARGVNQEVRPSRGNPVYVTVQNSAGPPFAFNASALSDEQRGEVLAYIRNQIQRNTAPPARN